MTLSMEPGLMVDTNVVSYVMRGDTLAKLYLPHLQVNFWRFLLLPWVKCFMVSPLSLTTPLISKR